MKRVPFLWCYTVPNAMTNHNFTDDCALCFALTKKGAIKKFRQFYSFSPNESIDKVYLNFGGIAILTDY
jgi:hypothetical protein